MSPKNIRVFELRLSKRSLVYFVFGVSCLLFLCFYLGIMVGRDMDAYPEKYAHGFLYAFLETAGWTSRKTENPSHAKQASSQESIAPEGGGQDLTFFDQLAKKKKDGMEAGGIVKQEPAVTSKEQSSSPPTVESIKRETEGNDSKKMHAETTQRVGTQGYRIQVVAYREKEKAETVARKIKKLGYSPHIEERKVTARGGRWYRVVLGGFETEKDARAAVDAISREINGVKCIVRSTERKSD